MPDTQTTSILEQMAADANTIKNEINDAANTATRVGSLFKDIVDYLSLLNPSSSVTLNEPLVGINSLNTPPSQANLTLVYDGSSWSYASFSSGGGGGTDMQTVWNNLALEDSTKQIHLSHLTTAFSQAGYMMESTMNTYSWWGRSFNSESATPKAISGALDGVTYINFSNGVSLGIDSDTNTLKIFREDSTAANIYATGGVSALGLGSSGSSGAVLTGLALALNTNDYLPSTSGYLHYNATENIYEWITNSGGMGGLLSALNAYDAPSAETSGFLHWNGQTFSWQSAGSGEGSVTSVTAGTGLVTDPAVGITSTGSIAISEATLANIANGVTAYGWGNHANAGYITSTVVSNYYLTKEDAATTYVSIGFFNRLFTVYGTNDAVISPNDRTSTINNIKVNYGLWTNSFISALGLNSSGGGSGGASVLNDLLDVNISSASDGQVLMCSTGSSTIWSNATLYLSSLSGVSISNPTSGQVLTYNGSNWVNGSISLSDYATKTWVNNNFIPATSGAVSNTMLANSSITIAGTTVSLGSSITATTIGNALTTSSPAAYATAAGTAASATSATYATSAGSADEADYATSAGSASSATYATSAGYATTAGSLQTAVSLWGNSFDGSSSIGTSSSYKSLSYVNSISMKGSITGAISIELNNSDSYDSSIGGFIDFHFAGSSDDYTSRIIEWSSGVLSIETNTSAALWIGNYYDGSYLQIGGIRIVYKSEYNALEIINYDGTAANLYATGGLSALGFSSGTSSTDSFTFNYLTVSNDLTVDGSIGDSDSNWNIEYTGYARFSRLYLDGTKYLYLSGSTLKYYNGSSHITIG